MKFSIAIPTLNNVSKLSKCLQRLSELDYPADQFEVLVIDNGSTDSTRETTLAFADKIRNLIYCYCESPGLMAARHMGMMKSKGEFLSFIDDDSLVRNCWLKGLDDAFSSPDVLLVGGPCLPLYESEPPDWAGFFWSKTKYGKSNGFLSLIDFGPKIRQISPDFVFGCNYNIRKKILLEIGGTYPDYLPEKFRMFQGSGESGVSYKIQDRGKTLYHPNAAIDHIVTSNRLTPDYFCWRAYFQGIGTSFQKIRQDNKLDRPVATSHMGLTARIINKLTRMLFAESKSMPAHVYELKARIEAHRKNGFNDHQDAVRNNPKLHAWILRNNYLGENEKLPD